MLSMKTNTSSAQNFFLKKRHHHHDHLHYKITEFVVRLATVIFIVTQLMMISI